MGRKAINTSKIKSARTIREESQIKQAVLALGKAYHQRQNTKAAFDVLNSQPYSGCYWSEKTKLWCQLSKIDRFALLDWMGRGLDFDDPISQIMAFLWLRENGAPATTSSLKRHIKLLARQYHLHVASQEVAA